MKYTSLPRRARGFTLIEFMIAGVLGLIVLGGVLHIMFNSKQVFTLQKAVADVQDDARFALQILGSDIERAGFGRSATLDAHLQVGANLSADGCSPGPAGTADADCITVQYDALQDCLGNPSNTAAPVLIRNTYHFVLNAAPDSDGVTLGQLQCTGSLAPNTPRTLLTQVETFQVSYGLDTNNDGVANRYVPANELTADGSGSADVVAVRVGLVLASAANVLDQPRNYGADELALLDTAGYTRNDRRLRRVFVQTIALPNRILSIP